MSRKWINEGKKQRPVFSTFSSCVTKFAKKCKGENDFGQLLKLWDTFDFNNLPSGFGYGDADTVAVDVIAAFMWKFRRIDHYFLATGVADFCAESVKEFSSDFCKALPTCTPVEPPTFQSRFLASKIIAQDSGLLNGAFAIHFPTKERTRSVVVIPDQHILNPTGTPNEIIKNSAKPVGSKFFFVSTDGVDVILMQQNTKPESIYDPGAEWIARLIFGLSLYIDAFPETVVKAEDGTVMNLEFYSKSCEAPKMVIGRNSIIEEEDRHKISPHWRRGHFRILNSERFTRKQGQTVYVRGSFVKGRAFDVLNDTPKPELSSK